jgi:hypothetical protein
MNKNAFTQMWNQRYSEQPYAYGTAPNTFIKAFLDTQKPGKILFAAEGEGRNAVYAAQQGWEVEAFDLSASGRDKALALAKQNGCEITYTVSDALSYQGGPYDAAAFCYFHTPEQVEDCYHHLVDLLHPEGLVVFEGFSVKNIGMGSGGPQKEDMCFTVERVFDLFKDLQSVEVWEEKVVLDEGKFHQGEAWVIRAQGVK